MQTVKEVRDWAEHQHMGVRTYVDYINDQRIRELIITAENNHKNVEDLILEITMQKKTEPVAAKPKSPNTRPRGVNMTQIGEIRLSEKQVRFLTDISGYSDEGKFNVSDYMMDNPDANPMSVGAMVTTLREKGILTSEKKTISGVKCCIIRLTEIGLAVYGELNK